MTEQEWKRRSAIRIYAAVKKAGRIRIRDLKRATHYNRGPEGSIPVWHDALDILEKSKRVVVERDENGNEAVVMLPAVADVLKGNALRISDLQVSPHMSPQSSPCGDNV